jgi:flagellar M-ring protein FliF
MAKGTKGPAAIVDGAKRFAAGFMNFTVGQKAVVVAVVAALIAGGVFFSRWASQPAYSPMFSNLSGTDASAMVDKLTSDGVSYQLADGGTTIMVPQDQVYALRLEMSGAGLPSDSQSGYSLLSQTGVTTSEFVQQKAYQQDLSNELAKTVEAISGVQSAVVNLAIPQKDVFLDEQQPTTASVLVKLRPGVSLSNDQVTSIVNLVAGGVEGMDPKNVSVVDDKGNTLSSDAAGSSAQQQKTSDFNTNASSNLQTLLEGVLGTGNVKATVNATLNFDAKTSKSTVYSQTNGVLPQASNKSTEVYNGSGTGGTASGVLGPDNIQVPAGTASASGDGGYSKTTETDDNSVNRTDTTTTAAPGQVQRQTVSVIVNSKTAGTADTAQIQQIVANAVGLDPSRGDSVSVTKMPFDTSAATAAATQLAQAAKDKQQAQTLSYAKTGALALLVLIMLFVVWRSFRRRKVESVDVLDVNAPPIHLGDITEDEFAEPRVLETAVRTPAVLEPAPVDPALEAAAARRDEVVELVSRQPEEVAELLRGWLADRRS